MRTLRGLALVATVFAAGQANAQDRYVFNQNQTGLALPGVTLPQGFDEVRGADGTSCRSSNTGSGAYADVGVIGGRGESGSVDTGAVYGRVVVPLGKVGTRLDCRKLYDLEIERLKAEVRMLKAGLDPRATATTTGTTAETAEHKVFSEGWSNNDPLTTGSVQPAPKGAQPPRAPAARTPPVGATARAAPTPPPANANAYAPAAAPQRAADAAPPVRAATRPPEPARERPKTLPQPSVFDSALRGSLRN